MTPRVSIIIPCYNQGAFLKETLNSVLACDATIYELIIVNDGSTDSQTNEYLSKLKTEGYQVIFQENKGLAGARNAGLEIAKGEFILPLDSDNKIRSQYLTEAILAMDADPGVAVVYANAQYFGDRTGVWEPGKFNMQRLMLSNYIDACALIRKSVLDKLGFYDTKMKYMGWEDWDMWLRIAFAGHKFFL
jgi:glycosyltransferase involved in cell wall biosynthesis